MIDLNYFVLLIFISRILDKSLHKNAEEMIEIGSSLDGHPSTQSSEGLFQPSRFKRLTMNFNLYPEPILTNEESSEQSCGAKLCKFSFRATSKNELS